jgi:molybdopterin molybdotransferase
MVSVQQATAIVMANLYQAHMLEVPVTEAVGKVLAENIVADRDFPPFNRVAMDGIAINSSEWKKGQRSFTIVSVQAAGEPGQTLLHLHQCIEVMTGAVLPENTDVVIRYEDVVITERTAEVALETILTFQNVHRQGQDAKKGDVLLTPGIILSSAEIALLASVGKNKVKILSFPKAAVVVSGDELVAIEDEPLPFQIRRSNTYSIQAAMRKLQWHAEQFHLPDSKDILKKSLEKIISDHDVVILSGGVSKGKFDFLPQVLEELGIKKLFHQVNQRPGKPFWFGASQKGKIVFALPGNPVSTFMCFYRFISPWFYQSLGVTRQASSAILASDFVFEPALTYFLQVALKNEGGRCVAYPKAGGGSGDFANLKEVDGFLELPAERSVFKAGEVFPFIAFRD